jgi:hypothetical protein
MRLYLTLNLPPPREAPSLWANAIAALAGVASWTAYATIGWHDAFGAMGFGIGMIAGVSAAADFVIAQDWEDRSITTPPAPPPPTAS